MISEKDVREALGRIREIFGSNAISTDADLGAVGLDSLDHATLLLDLHETSGIEFPEDAAGLNTIRAIVVYAQSIRP